MVLSDMEEIMGYIVSRRLNPFRGCWTRRKFKRGNVTVFLLASYFLIFPIAWGEPIKE